MSDQDSHKKRQGVSILKEYNFVDDPEMACRRIVHKCSSIPKTWHTSVLGLGALALLVVCYVSYDHDQMRYHYYQMSTSVERRTQSTRLVWTMSYPFSGMENTVRIVQNVSQTTYATNYGQFLQFPGKVYFGFSSRPIDPNIDNAPYRFSGTLPLPPGDQLTRTHCSGYCHEMERGQCGIADFIKPLKKFLNYQLSCSSGISYNNETGRTGVPYYNPNRVKKIIMQVRSPFTVTVSRYKRYQEKLGLPQTVANFFDWCKTHDTLYGSTYKTTFYTPEEVEASEGVQCHGEIYKIVNWHNQAFRVAEGMNIEPKFLYFEDYYEDLNGTVKDLFNYVGLKPYKKKYHIPFDVNYHDYGKEMLYYTQEQEIATKKFIQVLASPKSLVMYQRYMDHKIHERAALLNNGD